VSETNCPTEPSTHTLVAAADARGHATDMLRLIAAARGSLFNTRHPMSVVASAVRSTASCHREFCAATLAARGVADTSAARRKKAGRIITSEDGGWTVLH